MDPLLRRHFVDPLLRRLLELSRQARNGGARLPLIALNGPVGAGKSTLGRQLEALAATEGLRLVVASIDDLYLPLEERLRRLAGNPFGVSRVPPGSHDIPLLLELLERWRLSGELVLPRFDKTLADGQGDRQGWRRQAADALVLEGWLMGCRPLSASVVEALSDPSGRPAGWPGDGASGWASGVPALSPAEWAWLPRWNRSLEAYQPLWPACDGLWMFRPQHWGLPRRWRFQAEARQRRAGGGWLRPEALEGLVRSSLCSLPPALYQEPLIEAWGQALRFNREGSEWSPDPQDSIGRLVSPASREPSLSGQERIQPSSEAWSPGAESGAVLAEGGPAVAGVPGIRAGALAPAGSIPAGALAVLDGRRRCTTVWLQASLSSASSETG